MLRSNLSIREKHLKDLSDRYLLLGALSVPVLGLLGYLIILWLNEVTEPSIGGSIGRAAGTIVMISLLGITLNASLITKSRRLKSGKPALIAAGISAIVFLLAIGYVIFALLVG